MWTNKIIFKNYGRNLKKGNKYVKYLPEWFIL